MNKRGLICVALFWLLLNLALAQNGEPYHLKLLAVQDTGGNYTGSDADLYLEIQEGSGRVFLETFPLTKADTQVSTRFAKDIACRHFKLDCKRYDFIFTIKAKSNIIGGPSAGAAIAALTTIAMLDLPYDESVTITGTINSGGIIGPVGGVKEKLDAAAQAGISKVLIASGSSVIKKIDAEGKETNDTIDIIQYGTESLSLNVVETMDLDEALFHFTGKDLNHQNITITEDAEYSRIMQGLQRVLCTRTSEIEADLVNSHFTLNESDRSDIDRKIESADNATDNGDYYSAASFCFGANILLKEKYYSEKKLSLGMYRKLFLTLEQRVLALTEQLAKEKIETISDLQALMVVKERLNDVQEQIKKFNESPEENKVLLAYAEERFFSAQSWMQFFDMDGKRFRLDKDKLKKSCEQKIIEAEERQQYASVFVGEYLTRSIRESGIQAQAALETNEYELCLVKAAQGKAEANAILSSLGLFEENIDQFLAGKSKAVQRVIAENSQEGIFPILGYSYYRYADSLKETDKYNSLVYLEYALEMSNLEMYFEEEEMFFWAKDNFRLEQKWIFLGIGFLLGLLVAYLIFGVKWKRKRKK